MINPELRKELTQLVNDAFDKGDAIALIAMAITCASYSGNPKSDSDLEEMIKTALKNMSMDEIETVRDVLTNANPTDNEKELSYFERLLKEDNLHSII